MSNFGDYQTPERMRKKLAAVPLPELRGKSVLDIGCDHGAWCQLAVERGAFYTLGLDRGREVRGEGFVNLAERNRVIVPGANFCNFELGRQWHLFGRFDVVLMLNLYHHVYNVCGDHESIWFWLSKHVEHDGVLLWENPTDVSDGVARKDIRADLHAGYNYEAIRAAATRYFDVTDVGDGWVPTRRVWECRPKLDVVHSFAKVRAGAGGASKAFAYRDSARIKEIGKALGFIATPGSLNLQSGESFHWDRRYFRAQISDVVDRKRGLNSTWAPRWCRFYPVAVEGRGQGYAMRFENEHFASGKPYPETLIELISGTHLRTALKLENGEEVCLSS